MFTFDLETLIQLNSNHIICGDFNAHHTSWNCNNNNPRGTSLRSFSDYVELEILFPNSPTRYGSNSSSTIDLTVIKSFLFPYEIHSLAELSSDHNPILLCFYFKYSLPVSQGKIITNWKKFQNTLTNNFYVNILNINTPGKIDDLATEIENQINHAKIMCSSPTKPKQIMFNAELIKLNKDRNLARKMFQNSRNPALKRILNKLNKRLIKLSEKIENESLNNKLVNINTYDGKLWNFVKPFKSKKQNIPSLNDTANIALTDIEKAN
ncbi:hypothetical protein AVEN_48303-1 [Araneus ventricosus]|uniref:Endonuclease/exonuclease/phosphatase domain-containing protein n=1 Tax=Araneus ventricosus TaxID=182803 RepID=A0A4Y2VB92_ARAVE|nr:hypothetical protein AVEN_48303-1 [Araneus ventricosus]